MDNQQTAQHWGAIIVSIVSLVTFTGALIVAFVVKDEGLLNLTVGAAIANATTAVGYWLGSSSSSASKDRLIANGKGPTQPSIPPQEPPTTPS